MADGGGRAGAPTGPGPRGGSVVDGAGGAESAGVAGVADAVGGDTNLGPARGGRVAWGAGSGGVGEIDAEREDTGGIEAKTGGTEAEAGTGDAGGIEAEAAAGTVASGGLQAGDAGGIEAEAGAGDAGGIEEEAAGRGGIFPLAAPGASPGRSDRQTWAERCAVLSSSSGLGQRLRWEFNKAWMLFCRERRVSSCRATANARSSGVVPPVTLLSAHPSGLVCRLYVAAMLPAATAAFQVLKTSWSSLSTETICPRIRSSLDPSLSTFTSLSCPSAVSSKPGSSRRNSTVTPGTTRQSITTASKSPSIDTAVPNANPSDDWIATIALIV